MNGYLIIINETELDDVCPVDWSLELLEEAAEQRIHLGTVDVVESETGRIVFSVEVN